MKFALGIFSIFTLITVVFGVAAARQNLPQQASSQNEYENITLSKDNTLVLNATVTEQSMAELEQQLLAMSMALPADKAINLVLYTPGGDVNAGKGFIDAIRSIPQKVNTITIFSASMGFHIVENATGARLILPSGTLMSHRAKGGIEGEFGGNLNVRFNWISRQLFELEQATAKRMNLELPRYRALIRDEYWDTAQDAIKDGAADKIVLAHCDKSLSGLEERRMETLFGSVPMTFSKCPLITAPLAVKMPTDKISKDNIITLEDYITYLYSYPSEFVVKYVETEKYKTILK